MRRSLSLLSLLLAASACSTGTKAPADSTAVAAGDTGAAAMASADNGKDAIGKLRSSWKDMADKKDSAGVAGLYSDDAVLVGTDIPFASGRAEIEKRLGQMFAVAVVKSIDSKDTSVGGDVAYDYGTFSQTVTPPKGKPMEQTGYYLVTAKKQADGTWKITHHVSSTTPAK